MTSQGLKRPLDFDISASPTNTQHIQNEVPSFNSSTTSSTSATPMQTTTTTSDPSINDSDPSMNKRRCNNSIPNHYPTQQSPYLADLANTTNNTESSLSSPFKEPSKVLAPANDEIASLIKIELHKISNNSTAEPIPPPPPPPPPSLPRSVVVDDNCPVFTVRQTQTICEKVVKDREQKLRDEYDRILAVKLAEQYDLLAKANYINSYVESTRVVPSALPTPATSPSINALAAAFSTIQRSTTAPNGASAAASAATPSPSAASSISDLASIAAGPMSVNSHSSSLNPSQLAFNLQQQAAALALQAQQQQRVAAAAAVASSQSISNPMLPTGPVLLASNLDEQLATPDALFTLFGVFGDVIRVKILFNKKDNALIQMADANQASVAQGYLDKQRVFNKMIRVTRSKHQIVQMPRDGNQSDAGLTKDFTNSPFHRFKIPGSRNYLNIYPPSNTLHISNIPVTIEEADIHEAFKKACGFECSSFKFFPKDRKMALMKFNSIEHATIALIKMHNFQISDENNLRVSFSKSVI